MEKPHTALLSDVSFLSCNKKFWNSITSAWVGAAQNKLVTNFLNPENQSFENLPLVTSK